MIDNDISEEVFKRIQHKANVRSKIYYNNPQDKMLDYLTELELRIEALEAKLNKMLYEI